MDTLHLFNLIALLCRNSLNKDLLTTFSTEWTMSAIFLWSLQESNANSLYRLVPISLCTTSCTCSITLFWSGDQKSPRVHHKTPRKFAWTQLFSLQSGVLVVKLRNLLDLSLTSLFNNLLLGKMFRNSIRLTFPEFNQLKFQTKLEVKLHHCLIFHLLRILFHGCHGQRQFHNILCQKIALTLKLLCLTSTVSESSTYSKTFSLTRSIPWLLVPLVLVSLSQLSMSLKTLSQMRTTCILAFLSQPKHQLIKPN